MSHLEAGWITIKEVCNKLNVGNSRIKQLIKQQRLHARIQTTEIGSYYVVCEGCVEDYAKNRQKPGRPFTQNKKENN